MWWPAFLLPRRRTALTDALRAQIAAQIDARLAQRKAGRPAMQARARKSAATRAHATYDRDPLMRARRAANQETTSRGE